jgi:putative effector of murein hydrolase
MRLATLSVCNGRVDGAEVSDDGCRDADLGKKISGLPSLTAAIVILTGITGATLSSAVLDTVGARRDDVRGFAMGVASHGIGSARAFQISEEAGAYSGLGMAMNGTLSAFVLPVLLPLLSGWLI